MPCAVRFQPFEPLRPFLSFYSEVTLLIPLWVLFIVAVPFAVVSLGLGFYGGKLRGTNQYNEKLRLQQEDYEQRLMEVQERQRDVLREAREETAKFRTTIEAENRERRAEIKRQEQRLIQKEEALERKTDNLERRERGLATKERQLDQAREDLENVKRQQLAELERIAGLSVEEAKALLIASIEEQARKDAARRVHDIEATARDEAEQKAREIITLAIQRCASDQVSDVTVSVVPLPNDEMKGRIIGREGRNIRALEAATGVDLIIDDTPEAIVLSSFDPLRREIARLSLQRLVADGRIHPARIEEVVEKTKRQIEEQVIEIGERTVIELGIHGLHKELVRIVGKMRFRTSYGQNLLMHSREVANLCAVMAAELGMNPKLAKRAGLLHDIGKVPDEETELSHALLGMKLAEKYGENPAVVNAIGAHHDEVEMQYVISPVVQACDAISGARPGARREIMQQYLQRIKDLENLAMSYPGVEKAYAIQAGRELRVI